MACAKLAQGFSFEDVLQPGKALGLLWSESLECPSAADLACESLALEIKESGVPVGKCGMRVLFVESRFC